MLCTDFKDWSEERWVEIKSNCPELIQSVASRLSKLIYLFTSSVVRFIQNLTSTSFIIGTGLKKWRPPNLSTLFVALAMSEMGKEDVLLAKMVCLKGKVEIVSNSNVVCTNRPDEMDEVNDTVIQCIFQQKTCSR